MKCAHCKKQMKVAYTRYEKRDGRNVQAEVQLKCDCGMTVTISDSDLPSRSVSDSSGQTVSVPQSVK